ncbi:UNVERIFIED_CONTAM: nucleoside diphosphate kinase [Siphonaria sp. JEL0065]|nr:nucleoside diphosphate kinase [Siphonaria sp. JEL0065]
MFARRVLPTAARFARMASTSAAPRVASRLGAVAGAAAIAVGAGALYINNREPIFAAAAPVKTAAGTKGGIERTFIAIKPDGVQRGLISTVVDRFERKGYKLVAIKAIVPSKELAEEHYGDLKARPFYKGLVNYMTSGKAPVIAMVWEGIDVIRQGRRIIGATNPLESEPGSIRGDYTISVGRNAIHGSDSFESATIEIGLWFKPEEVYSWKQANEEWIISAN